MHFPAFSLVPQCSAGTLGPHWEVFWWVARDLDFYGWVMYQLHAAARTQHTTPSFMGFWPVPDALERFPMLISTHTTPPNSRLVYFALAGPKWPLGETATEKHTESTRFFISGANKSPCEHIFRSNDPTIPRIWMNHDGSRKVW